MGYQPDWQDIFSTDGSLVIDLLQTKVQNSRMVVHLVGTRYGAEPREPHPKYGRVSFTQLEALHARACKKQVIVVLCDGSFSTGDATPESDELRDLQASYRNNLEQGDRVFHRAKNLTELELIIRRIRRGLPRGCTFSFVFAAAAFIGLVTHFVCSEVAMDLGTPMDLMSESSPPPVEISEVEFRKRSLSDWILAKEREGNTHAALRFVSSSQGWRGGPGGERIYASGKITRVPEDHIFRDAREIVERATTPEQIDELLKSTDAADHPDVQE